MSSPTVSVILNCYNHEAYVGEAIESVGTRHRAAYRFALHHPNGIAIVISQDGGVVFVAQRQGKVVYWEQSVSP